MVIPSTTRVLMKLIGCEVTAINAGYVPLPMSKHKLDILLFQGLYHFRICFDSGANVFFTATSTGKVLPTLIPALMKYTSGHTKV